MPCSDLNVLKEKPDVTLPKQIRAQITLSEKANNVVIEWNGKTIKAEKKVKNNVVDKDIANLNY